VRRTPEEALYDGLVAAHHYLGYVRRVLSARLPDSA
jgi:hypothetical protein